MHMRRIVKTMKNQTEDLFILMLDLISKVVTAICSSAANTGADFLPLVTQLKNRALTTLKYEVVQKRGQAHSTKASSSSFVHFPCIPRG